MGEIVLLAGIDIKELIRNFESGALPGKMLLVRIIKNDIIDAYFKAG